MRRMKRTDSRHLPPTRHAVFVYDVRAKRARCVNPWTGAPVVGFVDLNNEINPADAPMVLKNLGPGFEVRSKLVGAHHAVPARKS